MGVGVGVGVEWSPWLQCDPRDVIRERERGRERERERERERFSDVLAADGMFPRPSLDSHL